MIRVPTHGAPTHPGAMLHSEFLERMGISRRELARDVMLPYGHVCDLARGRRRLTAGTALRLSRYLGTSVEFWMNLQLRWDLYVTGREEAEELGEVRRWDPRSRRS